jgi:predicted glycosyltransferase
MPNERTVGAAPASDPGVVRLRFLFYSHDGLGLGHVRRNLCVARALAEVVPGASILVATSVAEAELFGMPPGVDLLKLPGLRKIDNEHYVARRLPLSGDEVRSVRAHLLAAAVESFAPDVLLVDKHPFGIGGELLTALDTAREAGARIVLGLRDVLDDPLSVRVDWHSRDLYRRIPEHYDRVLIYGQPDVFDPRLAYDFPNELVALTRFCGYVVSSGANGDLQDDSVRRNDDARPFVIATAGGGEDGFALLSTFIQAASGGPSQALVVAGPQCRPSRARNLRALAAEAGVGFRRFVPNVSSLFPTANALVCMGGYNTLAEAVASGVPTVCVPRVRPRSEQLIRARALARFGLLRVVEPRRLDPTALRLEVEAAVRESSDPPPRNGATVNLGGARRAALHLAELATVEGRARRPAIPVFAE